MSWILTDTLAIQCHNIKRVERKQKEQITTPSFDFTLGKPIKNMSVKPVYQYQLITAEDTIIDISFEEFNNIREQLNNINQRDLEFTRYIQEHLEFKPGTDTFETVKREFYTPSN